MSRLMTRPCGPEPCSALRSIPASAAIRRARETRGATAGILDGRRDACPTDGRRDACPADGPVAVGRGAAAGLAGAGFGAGRGAGAGAGFASAGAGAGASSAEISSSGVPMTAISAPILMVSPGDATSFRMVPFV